MAKISFLDGAINDTLAAEAVAIEHPEAFTAKVQIYHHISTRLELLPKRVPKTSRVGSSAKRGVVTSPASEMMEWKPTETTIPKTMVQAQQMVDHDMELRGKRAKWVPRNEMERRKVEGRCLRYGRDGCRINRCPLSPAIAPSNQNSRQKVNMRPTVVTAAVESDVEEGNEDIDGDELVSED